MQKAEDTIDKLRKESIALRYEKAELLRIINAIDYEEIARINEEVAALKKQVNAARINTEYMVENLTYLNKKPRLVKELILRGKLFLNQLNLYGTTGISEQEQNKKLKAR